MSTIRLVRFILAAAYAALIAWATWRGGMQDGGDDSGTVAEAVLFLAGWAAASVVVGYVVGGVAFVLAVVAVAGATILGDVLDEFDNELWFFNSLILLAISIVLLFPGFYLRKIRGQSVFADSDPDSESQRPHPPAHTP